MTDYHYHRAFELDCIEFRRRCRIGNVTDVVDMMERYQHDPKMLVRLLDSKTLWVRLFNVLTNIRGLTVVLKQDGSSSVFNATISGSITLVRLLAEAGADVSEQKWVYK